MSQNYASHKVLFMFACFYPDYLLYFLFMRFQFQLNLEVLGYKIEKVHRILGALTKNCFNERSDQVEIHKLRA